MRLVGADFADVDEAFDAFGDLHEGAEVHELGDGAFDLRADGELAWHFGPGIGERLLETERDAALFGLDGEDDRVDGVALLENVAGMADLFAPGHFRDVDQAFDAGLDLDEGAEVHEARDRAGDALADLVPVGSGIPRLGLKLLEAKRNLLGFGIDLENADLEFLADGEHVFGLVDAAPGDVADVEQAIDAAEIDEGAVRHEACGRCR